MYSILVISIKKKYNIPIIRILQKIKLNYTTCLPAIIKKISYSLKVYVNDMLCTVTRKGSVKFTL